VFADVTVPVVDERSMPVRNLQLTATVTHEADASGPERVGTPVPVITDDNGYVKLSGVQFPAHIDFTLPGAGGEAITFETNLRGPNTVSMSAGEVVVQGTRFTKVNDRTADGEPISGPVTPTDRPNVKAQTVTYKFKQYVAYKSDALMTKRQVVDFRIPKPANASGFAPGSLKVFRGDTPVGVRDDGDSWALRVPRKEAVGDANCDGQGSVATPATFTVRGSTPAAYFARDIAVKDINIYEENVLPQAVLSLVSLRPNSVNIGGSPVGDSFRLSPYFWAHRGAGQLFGKEDTDFAHPDEISGRVALSMLGIRNMPKADDDSNHESKHFFQVPGPSNERYRFGQWIWLLDHGLGLRCRPEAEHRTSGRTSTGRVLPAPEDFGILEGIRFITRTAGDIGGVVAVGASRTQVYAALGPPDDSLSSIESKLGIGIAAEKSRNLLGSPDIECEDEAFFGGAIKVKWDGSVVKWFEIARPIQMLYAGTDPYPSGDTDPVNHDKATMKLGSVMGVNYEKGEFLVNLGSEINVHPSNGSEEGTILELYLLDSVDPKTGYHRGDLESLSMCGGGRGSEWLEVVSAGRGYCIAKPRIKRIGGTSIAYGVLPRFASPESGLLRVRIKKL